VDITEAVNTDASSRGNTVPEPNLTISRIR